MMNHCKKIIAVAVSVLLTLSVALADVVATKDLKQTLQTLQEGTTIAYLTKDGEITDNKADSTYYRKLIKKNADGSFVAQDFYTASDKKQIDPITLIDVNELYAWGASSIDGPFVSWYENGKKESQGIHKKGKAEGIFSWWYESGEKQSEATYKEGLQEGVAYLWYENGHRQAEVTYKNGKQEGLATLWYENGQKQTELTNKNDQPDGVTTNWYKNGQKQAEMTFKDGLPEGFVRMWYESGEKQIEMNFKQGKQDGIATSWHKNGQKQIEAVYKEGVLIKTRIWDAEGNETAPQ